MENSQAVKLMKQQATNLARMIQGDFGRTIPRAEALERVAQLHGFRNWDTAVACASGAPTQPAPAILDLRDQIGQLIAFRRGLSSGIMLVEVVATLARQPEPRAAAGWGRVDLQKNLSVCQILADTLLFDGALVPIGMIGDQCADWQATLTDMIAYLSHLPELR